MKRKSKKYQESLIESLKNPREAAAYLNAALDDGDEKVFLLALRNVAEAYGGMGKLSESSRLNRENLYRMLSKKGNPELGSLNTLLNSLGLKLSVKIIPSKTIRDMRGFIKGIGSCIEREGSRL